MLIVVPVVIVSFFGMFKAGKGLAKFVLITWLVLSLLLVLLMELVAPYFLSQSAVRPDLAALAAVENPVDLMSQLWSKYLVPAVIGIVLLVLIMIAYWSRLETSRMLRYPVSKFSGLLFLVLAVAACVFAIRSSWNPEVPALGPDASLISTENVLNEITLNGTYKTIHALVTDSGLLEKLPKIPYLSSGAPAN